MLIDQDTIRVIIVVVISYLLGSTPTAYMVARINNVDIFSVGSGSMGGTNVIRAVGLRWGIFTGVVDGFKGILAVFIARQIMSDHTAAATTIAAAVAIAGHNWSLFAALLTATVRNGKVQATFRGGKGGATAFGTMLMFAPLYVIAAMLFLFGLILAVTRYVSLGVLLAFALALLWLAVLVGQQQLEPEFIFYTLAVAAMMLIRFRENIQRLLTGTERRFGERA
jgi:glycerol-3-phosphate acyltransferase PlsY